MRHSENENLSLKVFNRSDISTNNILSESNKLNGNDFMVYHKHNNSSSSDDDLNNSKTNGFRKCEEPYNIDDSFGNYAETDLDQTTNFSLRFHEQGRPDVERSEMQKKGESNFIFFLRAQMIFWGSIMSKQFEKWVSGDNFLRIASFLSWPAMCVLVVGTSEVEIKEIEFEILRSLV